MKYHYGSVWDNYPQDMVVVPVNIGWKRNGEAVMGAGLAREAASRFPELPRMWGGVCQQFLHDTPIFVHENSRMILFPTKPLDEDSPWASWKADADSKLIWRSAAQLAAVWGEQGRNIAVPLAGCGCGRLLPELVIPILQTFLSHPRFHLVVEYKHRAIAHGLCNGDWDNWLLFEDPRPNLKGKPVGSHFVKDYFPDA